MPHGRRTMTASEQIAFPATPGEVATLTIQEFTFDLYDVVGTQVPSIERVCRTFLEDANRALVWWIRFGALKTWCASIDGKEGASSDSRILRDAYELAASFPLNPLWEFDPNAFGCAVQAVAVTRARTTAAR